jgi:hypothetical protein
MRLKKNKQFTTKYFKNTRIPRKHWVNLSNKKQFQKTHFKQLSLQNIINQFSSRLGIV